MPLKIGSTLTVGSMSIKIAKVGKPDWGDAKLSIQFSSKQDFAKIKSWEFLDAKGQKIEHDRSSSGSMGFAGNMTYFVSYNLGKKVESITLSLTYFDKMETLLVPIALKTGVGMGPS